VEQEMPRKWSNVELSGAQKLNLGPAGPKRAGGAIGLDSRGLARRGKLPKAEVLKTNRQPREQGGNAAR